MGDFEQDKKPFEMIEESDLADRAPVFKAAKETPDEVENLYAALSFSIAFRIPVWKNESIEERKVVAKRTMVAQLKDLIPTIELARVELSVEKDDDGDITATFVIPQQESRKVN